MGKLTALLIDKIRNWDQQSQIGFVLAILLLFPALLIALTGPDKLRWPATISVMGLIIMAQVIFLWANRGMVSDFARAQRLYREGDFQAVSAMLEQEHAREKRDVQSLTLLGNAYRQLGRLDDSEAALRQALDIDPHHHFPLYGLGRTLMAQGRYEEAAEAIERLVAEPDRHAKAAHAIAEEYFDSEKVLTRLIENALSS